MRAGFYRIVRSEEHDSITTESSKHENVGAKARDAHRSKPGHDNDLAADEVRSDVSLGELRR